MDGFWSQLLQSGFFSPETFLRDIVTFLGFVNQVRVAQCCNLSEIVAGKELPQVPFLLN